MAEDIVLEGRVAGGQPEKTRKIRPMHHRVANPKSRLAVRSKHVATSRKISQRFFANSLPLSAPRVRLGVWTLENAGESPGASVPADPAPLEHKRGWRDSGHFGAPIPLHTWRGKGIARMGHLDITRLGRRLPRYRPPSLLPRHRPPGAQRSVVSYADGHRKYCKAQSDSNLAFFDPNSAGERVPSRGAPRVGSSAAI